MSKPKQAKATPEKWGCKYLLTLNKHTLTALLMNVTTSELPETVAGKIAVEVGEKGNLHKHMYLVFKRSIRKDTLVNKVKAHGCQVDLITPGTEATVIDYVGNHDKEVSKGCTIIDEYTTQWGNIDVSQGQRNDLTSSDVVLFQIKDALDGGATLRDIYNDFFPYMVRYGRGIIDYIQFCKQERDKTPTGYAVNKSGNRMEYESLERWTDDKTKILLDLDPFRSEQH